MVIAMTETATDRAKASVAPRAGRPAEIRKYRIQRMKGWLLALAGWAILLGAWQLAPSIGLVNPIFSSSPSGAISRLFELLISGAIWSDIYATTMTMAVGLALGIVVGVISGILFGWFVTIDRMTNSVVVAMYSLPYVALVPLVILWFGIGEVGRVTLVFWAALFPMVMNTASGVRNLDRSFLRVAKGFCAPQLKTITTVVLPGSLPYILAGVRLAVGRALVAAIVAEFFMSSAGLGYVINNSTAALNMDTAFAALIITAGFGVFLVWVTTMIENKFSFWTHAE